MARPAEGLEVAHVVGATMRQFYHMMGFEPPSAPALPAAVAVTVEDLEAKALPLRPLGRAAETVVAAHTCPTASPSQRAMPPTQAPDPIGRA